MLGIVIGRENSSARNRGPLRIALVGLTGKTVGRGIVAISPQHIIFTPYVDERSVLRRVVDDRGAMNVVRTHLLTVRDDALAAAGAPGRKKLLHQRRPGPGVGHLCGIEKIKVPVFTPADQETIGQDCWGSGAQVFVGDRIGGVLEDRQERAQVQRYGASAEPDEALAQVRSA